MWSCLLLSCFLHFVLITTGKECTEKDFHFKYTECDSHGKRWRVSVPKDDCEGGSPLPPIKGPACDKACDEGEYLDVQSSQKCQKCEAGTFSLGGGVRFDDWDHLPTGFHKRSEPFSAFLFSRGEKLENCSSSEWKPMGKYIAGFTNGCSIELEYSINLVNAGNLMFEYQYFKQGAALFHYAVQNEKCQSNEEDNENDWPAETEEGQWKKVNVKLKSGFNVFFWKVWDIMSDDTDEASNKKPAVLIRQIEVQGAAYTSECTKCKNGTYSSGGTDFCTACEANSFSEKGAKTCTKCDTATEYSEVGALKCRKKPPCTEHDYFADQTPCDEKKKTKKIYKWLQPQICRTDVAGAVQLPKPTEPQDCPNCNPGMESVKGKGCMFCSKNQYSDGEKCQDCHVSTIPELQYEYNWWNYMPHNVTTRCLTLLDSQCRTHSSWVPNGDNIMTRYGRGENAYLLLMFDVTGFRGPEDVDREESPSYGRVIFDFETSCADDCELSFISDDEGENRVVKSWIGKHDKTTYSYSVRQMGSATFSWAFQHSESPHGMAGIIKDFAKIYSIKVTNTVDGGAVSCKPCPQGKSQNGCVPCPDGQYIDRNVTKCMPCPEGTVVPVTNAFGKESCKSCGDGLKAFKGKTCISDCKISDSQGREYDFTKINNVRTVLGSHLFTASGAQYYHSFNMSLCGNEDQLPVTCYNNVTYSHEKNKDADKVDSVLCRSTIIPPRRKDEKTVSTMPVSLGDKLTQITINDSSVLKKYVAAGFPTDHFETDVHFTYTSDISTRNCENGRQSIVSLRCDVKETENGTIDLPPKCPDGTCDGCSFHFLWRTMYACPICRAEDYSIIVGECLGGEQTVHYIPPENCLMKDKTKAPTKKQKCSVIPFAVQLAIPITVGVALLMLALLCYCWKRNRKLEYKYSKLIESSSGRDEDLPAADSCAFDNDEEERLDRVGFKDAKRGGILNKFKIGSSGKNDDFETMRLDEKMPLT